MSNKSLAKEKIKILLLEGVHQSAVEELESQGYSNIEYLKTSLAEDELIEKIASVHFIGIRSRTMLNEKVLSHAKKLVAIDSAIEPHVDRPLNEVDHIEKAILRVAIFELSDCLDVPYRVVINEAIELAKIFAADDSHKFVNGVLDKAVKLIRPEE